MKNVGYYLLRGFLFAVAGIAGAVVILTIDSPTVPLVVPIAAFVVCLVFGSAFFWVGQLQRAPLDKPAEHTLDIPGGRIAATWGWGSPDFEDVVVIPADGRGPLRLGTVNAVDWQRLCCAPDPLRLRVQAGLMGGVR